MVNRFDMDETAVTEVLEDPEGLVGRELTRLAEAMQHVAEAKAPVRTGNTWSSKSNARPPGFLKEHVRTHHADIDHNGSLFSGVDAPADPTIFLEKPARQMHEAHPFLTTALWTSEL